MIWHNLKRRINKPWAIWLLIPIWLGYEYGHTLWDLTWSWLILGNAFAFNHNWVQWYEFTGTSGGSLWILIVNILFFNVIKNIHYTIKQIAKPIAVIIIPIALSYIILSISTTQLNSAGSYKTLIVHNSGVEITTEGGSNARAVFGGDSGGGAGQLVAAGDLRNRRQSEAGGCF